MGLLILVIALFCVVSALNIVKTMGAGLLKLSVPVIGATLIILTIVSLFS